VGTVAGIPVTPTRYTACNVGVRFGVYGLIAAVSGGFGSASRALASGVLPGAIWALVIVTFGAGYTNVVALSVLLVALPAFPNGMLGGHMAPRHLRPIAGRLTAARRMSRMLPRQAPGRC